MGHSEIVIRGAAEHNLKRLDLTLPRESLITITGVSGSGKSSLAFDTLFREGQRRFLESLSAYARQFVGRMEKPQVESITGLSPTISIDQKTVNRNPRSTVGTVTEVYDYLRLLFARLGTAHCPGCQRPLASQTADHIVDTILQGAAGQRLLVLAPMVRGRKGLYRKELDLWRREGFVRVRIDGHIHRLDETIELGRYERHDIELVVDRLRAEPARRSRLAEAVEGALRLGSGQVSILDEADQLREYATTLSCPTCGISLPEMEPRLFSFNSPQGACATCNGLGVLRRVDPRKVIPDPTRSIASGAIAAMTTTGYLPYVKLNQGALKHVAKELGFTVEQPWNTLTEAQQNSLLYGTRKAVRVRFEHQSKSGNMQVRGDENRRLPGIVPSIQKAWENTHPRHLEKFLSDLSCQTCDGQRLRAEALAVHFREHNIHALASLTLEQAGTFFDELQLSDQEQLIGEGILRELRARLGFLREVGIGYLTLHRSARSLSGGESQRVRLATQVGAGLQGVLYVLDEPSIGLHARDHHRLLGTLRELRDRRNTVVVVEHDRDTMLASDWLVDIGPGAGRLGGELVADGPLSTVLEHPTSRTAMHLRGEARVPRPTRRREGNGQCLRIEGARQFHLKNLSVDLPLGCFLGVTGVSGSGKSTLVHRILHRALAHTLHRAEAEPGEHDRILGVEHVDKVIEIDQSPIGRTPRSNPATYTKLWDLIRDLLASTPEAKARGYAKGRFSFNVRGGRCEQCQGAGIRTIEMQFLADVEVPCEECVGRRFNRETLEIRFKGRTVHDLLEATVAEASELFEAHPRIKKILDTMTDVGLDYLHLGQPSTTLSGGEAQRIKLAAELARPATGRTLYILDEPTTGLHFDDIHKLVNTLDRLVEHGNTVLVIEHNLDVIQACDQLIELGPEGGAEGGRLLATGTPEELAKAGDTPTGLHLRSILPGTGRKPRAERPARRKRATQQDQQLLVRGASKNNLRHVDVTLPHDRLSVITGVSGSGKTSLAFDTLFAEGQRRFVESLSTYARRFFSRLDRAPVDQMEGLRPAIAIDQRAGARNPRSTVATSTEIQDHLRLLFARLGQPHCPGCDQALRAFTPTSAATDILEQHDGERLLVTAPLFRKGARRPLLLETSAQLRQTAPTLAAEGFLRVLLDGEELRLDADLPKRLAGLRRIDLVLDRVKVRPDQGTRVAEALEEAFLRGHGQAEVRREDGTVRAYATRAVCARCDVSLEDFTPRHFSFNHHLGACPDCEGLGRQRRVVEERVIVRPERPLLKGALVDYPGRYFKKKSSYVHAVLVAAAEHVGADLDRPFLDWTPRQKAAILYGEHVADRLPATLRRRRGGSRREYTFQGRWRGILGEIERWLRNAQEGKWWVDRLLTLTKDGACSSCGGARLRDISRAVRLSDRPLHELTALTVQQARRFFEQQEWTPSQEIIARQPLKEITGRLRFMEDVGLGYLTLDRPSGTLSGGEAQRIRLAQQLGSGLVGVLYVLDEPSIGLHSRDTERLMETLRGLQELGNTVVLVEHDEDIIRAADYLVDMGPGAGRHGGEVVAAGSLTSLQRHKDSLTGAYLSGQRVIPLPTERRPAKAHLEIRGAHRHNLKDLDVSLPLGTLTVVTGVSGSGKSTLVMDVLRDHLRGELQGKLVEQPGCQQLLGADEVRALIDIDQSPIGTTPSSNPATYTKLFDPIREVFASTPAARMKGFDRGRFSFNQGAGRCEGCQGRGAVLVEMHFLSDLWVPCESCRGRRYNQETLSVTWQGRTIADVLDMEVREAREFFAQHRRVKRVLDVLADVGLEYLQLGQSSTTLSGGEAQRVKLAAELARASTQRTMYLLDEPTTGLHLADVEKLVHVLHRLVERGNTVLVIEHHPDVIKNADHVIDLGPEGGEKGGHLVVTGTPEEVAAHPTSHTGRHLRETLERQAAASRKRGPRKERAGAGS